MELGLATFMSVLIPLALVSEGCAEHPKDATNPGAWSIKSYRLGRWFSSNWRIDEEATLPQPSQVIMTNPSEAGIRAFILKCTEIIGPEMKRRGFLVSEGALIAADLGTGFFAVRTTNEAHTIWDAVEQQERSNLPSMLHLQFDLFDAPNEWASAALVRSLDAEHHADLLKGLILEVDAGRAKRLKTYRCATRSGQRVEMNSGGTAQLSVPSDGQEKGATTNNYSQDGSMADGGMKVECVTDAADKAVDLNLSLGFASNEGTVRRLHVNDGDTVQEVGVRDRFLTVLKTATTLRNGEPRMVGAWNSESEGLRSILFAQSVVEVIEPESDRTMESWLQEHGESVLPTPAPLSTADATEIPEGMVRRRFRVPPDFILMPVSMPGGSEPGSDPFAPVSEEERKPRECQTAKEVLEAQGISFPDGSRAVLIGNTGVLEIVNTPAALDQLEVFLSPLGSRPPRVVDAVIRIVEADAKGIREASLKAISIEGHRQAWETIRAHGVIVGEYFITTKSGQRVLLDSGSRFHLSRSPDTTSENGERAGIPVETVGMTWELDPVVGPDGDTVDIHQSVKFDVSPPVEKIVEGVEVTQFFEETLSGAATQIHGQNRLIGVWDPEFPPGQNERDVLHAVFLEVRSRDVGAWSRLGLIEEEE